VVAVGVPEGTVGGVLAGGGAAPVVTRRGAVVVVTVRFDVVVVVVVECVSLPVRDPLTTFADSTFVVVTPLATLPVLTEVVGGGVVETFVADESAA
jgi:hypothetical protein